MEVLKYFIIFFLMSMSNVGFIADFRITIADITLIIIILYTLIFKQRLAINEFSISSIIFFLMLFLINIFNIFVVEDINVKKIIFNYLKFLLFISIVLCFPILIKKEKLNVYFKSLMLVIILHSLIMIIASIWGVPWRFEGHLIIFENNLVQLFRPYALFGESSFWGIFLIIYFSLIIQYEINSKDKVIKWWHVFLISVSVFLVKSITCYFVMILLISYFIYSRLSYQKIYLIVTPIFLVIVFLSLIEVDLREIDGSEIKTFISSDPMYRLLLSYAYMKERLINFFIISDGSTNQRIIGSYLYTIHVLEQSPFLGSGLGSENLQLIYKDKDFYSMDYLVFNEEKKIPIKYSQSTFFAVLIGSGGIFTLIYFYVFILGKTIIDNRSIFFGVLIFILGFSNGGIFQEHIWIALTSMFFIKRIAPNKALLS